MVALAHLFNRSPMGYGSASTYLTREAPERHLVVRQYTSDVHADAENAERGSSGSVSDDSGIELWRRAALSQC
jgi:hypothetical protein